MESSSLVKCKICNNSFQDIVQQDDCGCQICSFCSTAVNLLRHNHIDKVACICGNEINSKYNWLIYQANEQRFDTWIILQDGTVDDSRLKIRKRSLTGIIETAAKRPRYWVVQPFMQGENIYEAKVSYSDIPNDVWVDCIALYLDPASLVKLRRVNRYMCSLINVDTMKNYIDEHPIAFRQQLESEKLNDINLDKVLRIMEAQYYYHQGKDYVRALDWKYATRMFIKAGKKGHFKAQYRACEILHASYNYIDKPFKSKKYRNDIEEFKNYIIKECNDRVFELDAYNVYQRCKAYVG